MFEYYANNQWDFDNANILHLRSIVNKKEAAWYPIEDNGIIVTIVYWIIWVLWAIDCIF